MRASSPQLDVWVLAGQSNMQGFGWRKDALPPHPLVSVFSSAGTWEQAQDPLHRPWESFTPVHQELMRPGLPPGDQGLSDLALAEREAREGVRGAGLGLAVGTAVAERTGEPVGLVPAAHDGTRLEQWSASGKGRGGHSLYGAILERIARAGGRLRGLLWYQGESDAHEMADARSYAGRLDRWIAALRADTDMPGLPVLAVQIGRALPPKAGPGSFPGWDIIREALGTLPERIPSTAVTSAVDLPLVDCLHVSASGLIRLGRRLARLVSFLDGVPGVSAGPRVRAVESWRTPGGEGSGLRVAFEGVSGGWKTTERLQGFSLHPSQEHQEEPPVIVNAWVDREAGDDVILLLTRPLRNGEMLGYGCGLDPRCDLVDAADMPLCTFLPRVVDL
jgi:hypothetical protein